MKISTQCPQCQTRYTISSELAGKRVGCKKCGGSFVAATATDTEGTQETASPQASTVAEAASAANKKLPTSIGRYLIRDRAGVGAFGAVYRAFDPKLEREVALKVPRRNSWRKPGEKERFVREAKSAAGLRHPNIVPVYDAEVEGSEVYITSAFIEGITLEERLKKERMVFRTAVKISIALAQALDYAHRQEIVHRDIKPGNIMLDARGEPMLMDFGLARSEKAEPTTEIASDGGSGTDSVGSELTQQGMVMGTPAYMSPEQAAGRNEEVKGPSDQYSLGVVLFEMLCGARPFDGISAVVMSHHLHDEPVFASDHSPTVPEDLRAICLKTLRKSPTDRYPNCGDLALDLQRWLSGERVSARKWSVREVVQRWAQRNPFAAALSLVATVLSAGIFVVTLVAYWQTSTALRSEAEQRRAAVQALRDKEAAEAAKDEEYRQRLAALEDAAQARAEKDEAEQEKAKAELAKTEADIREQIAQVEADRSAYIDTVWRGYQGLLAGRDPRQVMDELDKAAERHRSWEWHFVYGLCSRGWRPNLVREIKVEGYNIPTWSANGKWLATAQTDAKLTSSPPQLPFPMRPQEGTPEENRRFSREMEEHQAQLRKLQEEAVKARQAQVAAASGRWSIYDLTADVALLTEKTEKGIPGLLAISDTGQIVVCSFQGDLQIRTSPPSAPKRIPSLPSDATRIKYSPDLQCRAALVRNGRAAIIQRLDGAGEHTWEVGTPGNRMNWILEFDNSGSYLLSASSGGKESHVRIWAMQSATEIMNIALPPHVVAASLGEDGVTLAVSIVNQSGESKNHVEIWDLKSKALKRRLPETSFISYPKVRVFSSLGLVASNLPNGQILGHSLEWGHELVRLNSFSDDQQSNIYDFCMFAAAEGLTVRTLGKLSQVDKAPTWAVCDWRSGHAVVSQFLEPKSPLLQKLRTWNANSTLQRQYTSPDGKYSVLQRGTKTVLVDLLSPERRETEIADVTPISYAFADSIVISGDQLLVDQGAGSEIVQYSITQQKVTARTSNSGFGGHGGTIAYSPNTGEVVIPGFQRLLRWHPATNVRQEIPLSRLLQPCVVTPDGKRLIGRDIGGEKTGSIDGDLLVLDVESGREVFRLPFPSEAGRTEEIHVTDDGLSIVARCGGRNVAWTGQLKSP